MQKFNFLPTYFVATKSKNIKKLTKKGKKLKKTGKNTQKIAKKHQFNSYYGG